jgi:hypothetical protein
LGYFNPDKHGVIAELRRKGVRVTVLPATAAQQ